MGYLEKNPYREDRITKRPVKFERLPHKVFVSQIEIFGIIEDAGISLHELCKLNRGAVREAYGGEAVMCVNDHISDLGILIPHLRRKNRNEAASRLQDLYKKLSKLMT